MNTTFDFKKEENELERIPKNWVEYDSHFLIQFLKSISFGKVQQGDCIEYQWNVVFGHDD